MLEYNRLAGSLPDCVDLSSNKFGRMAQNINTGCRKSGCLRRGCLQMQTNAHKRAQMQVHTGENAKQH